MVQSVTNTDFMKAFLSFAMSHGTVHGMHVHLFLPGNTTHNPSTELCAGPIHGISPQLHNKCGQYTHTHTHSFMPLAEVQLSLCQLSQNTQSLSKFLQISLIPNLIHTNKIHTKYHLHCSVDYGFNHFCF
jgi:hypothetical protein